MNPTSYSTGMSRRRLLAFYLLGVLLLAGSVAGASFALHSQGGGTSPSGNEISTGDSGDRRVICFGVVDVPGGIVSMYPLVPGQVTRILVEEGQQVAKGAILFETDTSIADLKVKEARATKEAAEVQVKKAQNLAARFPFDLQARSDDLEKARHDLSAADALNQHMQDLVSKNLANTAQAKAAAEKVEANRSGLKASEAQLEALKRLDPSLDVALAGKNLATSQAILEEAEHGVTQYQRTAPCDGTVFRVLANAGDVYGPQSHQPVLQICPNGRRIVRAEVEQEFAGRVAKGQIASFQDDTTGEGMWHGKVIHVSDWFTQRRMILPEPLQLHDVRTLECIIEIDPNQPPLRINQRMRVTIGR
jgi:multidrug resistance efflux pump